MSTDREWVGRDKTETEKSATRWSRGINSQTDRQTDTQSRKMGKHKKEMKIKGRRAANTQRQCPRHGNERCLEQHLHFKFISPSALATSN